MNESERSAEFPVHIDLAFKANGLSTSQDKPVEPRYPTLYISGVKGIDKLAPKGCMLVDYEVVGFHKGRDNPGSVEIECKTICIQGDPEEKGEYDEANDAVDEMAKKAGFLKGDEEGEE